MKIATLNMQGQLIEQIRGMRIQKSLKEQLVQSIIDKQIDGLIGCLKLREIAYLMELGRQINIMK